MSYIGPKKIKDTRILEEKTPANQEIIEVTYVDKSVENLTKMMYDEIVSEKSCDLTTLRDKRVRPIVGSILAIFREWGLKVGETQYMSILLNQSLDSNKNEAEKELWRKVVPNLVSLDDVDMIGIDKVLKSIGVTPSPYYPDADEK